MELFKCQAVLPFLAVTIGAILADSEPDNGKTLAMTKGDRVPYHATWRLHMKFVEKGKTQEYCGPRTKHTAPEAEGSLILVSNQNSDRR